MKQTLTKKNISKKITTTSRALIFFSILFLTLSALFFNFYRPAIAASYKYIPMEKIPGFEGAATDFPSYISSIYKFGIWAVGIAALFMLIFGGFMYITSAGNTSKMDQAKTYIMDAIFGVIVALGAWLLLYVINPDLVKINLEGLKMMEATAPPIESSEVPSAVPPAAITTFPGGTDKEIAKRILKNNKIILRQSGDCKDQSGTAVTPTSNISAVANGQNMIACSATCKTAGTPCTLRATPPNKMLSAMECVTTEFGLSYTVTSVSGGQHSVTSNHYKGRAIDVVNPSDTLYNAFQSCGGNPRCERCKGACVKTSCNQADHIHINF